MRVSTKMRPTEDITLSNGFKLIADQPLNFNIIYLQTNAEHWREPDEYIPERFDPTSEYFLRPDGKKRHPMCYQPFLGGRRICLGKSFAETIVKCVLAMFIAMVDFEFADPKIREKKPPNTFVHREPVYDMFVKEAPAF